MLVEWILKCDVELRTAWLSLLDSCDLVKRDGQVIGATTRVGATCECDATTCRNWCAAGVAKPADAEAVAACQVVGLVESTIENATLGQQLMRAHCLEEPYRSRFLAGYISAVDLDGNEVPGPKWDEYQATIPKTKEEDETL